MVSPELTSLPFDYEGELFYLNMHPGYFDAIRSQVDKDRKNNAYVLEKVEWELDKDDYICVYTHMYNKYIENSRFLNRFYVHFCMIDDKNTFLYNPMTNPIVANISKEHRALFTAEEIQNEVPSNLRGIIGPVTVSQMKFTFKLLQDRYKKLLVEDSDERKMKEAVKALLLTEYLLQQAEDQQTEP